MTILFLVRLFYPHIGGVEKHCLEVGKRLIAKGHKVIVITEKLSDVITEENTTLKNGIKIYRIPVDHENKLKKFRIWFWLFKNRSLIKKSDIIHCHDVFFWYLPFRFLYLKKPVYTTFHGYESYPISQKAIIIRKISEKLSYGNICIGDFIKKWYGTKPDFVSCGAVEILHHKSYILNQSKKESALFIGRLDEQTGILTYIKAVEKIKKEYPQFDFLIIGDGNYKEIIDKKAKTIGFQKNPEKYLLQFNFAFVSRYLSILEAMAAKRLVFAVYDNPIKEDYLKMTPFKKFIIIEKNPDILADRIIYYLKNPYEAKQRIDNGYKWVMEQTWDNLVNMYMKLWGQKK
jgi:glycosyltransferase involved in cell wall biosynthesis